jgi:hypothetical protein
MRVRCVDAGCRVVWLRAEVRKRGIKWSDSVGYINWPANPPCSVGSEFNFRQHHHLGTLKIVAISRTNANLSLHLLYIPTLADLLFSIFQLIQWASVAMPLSI